MSAADARDGGAARKSGAWGTGHASGGSRGGRGHRSIIVRVRRDARSSRGAWKTPTDGYPWALVGSMTSRALGCAMTRALLLVVLRVLLDEVLRFLGVPRQVLEISGILRMLCLLDWRALQADPVNTVITQSKPRMLLGPAGLSHARLDVMLGPRQCSA